LVPWADFNCFVLEPSAIKGKLASITLMSDVLPTALYAVENAEVSVGKTVYIAGAGPIGLTCAHFSLLKGAACVIVGDVNQDRLKQAKEMGCFIVDCGKVKSEKMNQELSQMLHGTTFVDCAIDAVGFESSQMGHGHIGESHVQADRTAAINSCIQALKTGGNLSIPGVYLPGDTQEKGPLQFDLQNVFMKGLTIKTGQTPCASLMPFLYQSILFGRTDVTRFLNVRVIPLNEASEAYKQFHAGQNVKYIIDPNGLFQKYNGGALQLRTQGAPTVGGTVKHM
jgi:glutathione-independent formaldehyde dehydrogenase